MQLTEYKIADIGRVITGKTPPGSRDESFGGNVYFLTPTDMDGTRRPSKIERTLSELGQQQLQRLIVSKGVAVSCIGSQMGKSCLLVSPFATNQQINTIVPDESKVDLNFLYYLLSSMRDYLFRLGAGAGSTMPILNKGSFENISISLPDLNSQKKIASVLSKLDDKIELNNQINETLESIAKTIYKELFIDFGPVKAKAESKKPFGIDDETASLFPDAFENSELGMIPKGWKISFLSEIFSVKHGYAFKGDFFSEFPTNDILLTPGNFKIGGGFKGDKLKYYNGPEVPGYLLKKNDLVITMTDLSKAGDTLGYPALVPEVPPIRYLHNQRIGLVNSKFDGSEKFWVYQLLQTDSYRSWILGSCTGSTVKHTSPSRVEEFRFINPGLELMSRYHKLATPIFEKISANHRENQILENTRDLLLPKLISGQLPLNEVVSD